MTARPALSEITSKGHAPAGSISPSALPRGVRPDRCFALRVTGNCLYPDFRDGDRVVFCEGVKIRSGDACLVWLNDGRWALKRVRLKGRGVVELYFTHPTETHFATLRRSEIKHIVKAVAAHRPAPPPVLTLNVDAPGGWAPLAVA
jgi:phage repressor protein C with HTH and peptisase S24 domain